MLSLWQQILRTNQHFSTFLCSVFSSQADVTCSSPVAHTDKSVTEYTAQCQKENYCPFAEEHQPIEMFLEIIDEVEYENYSSSFFIRDISE